MFDLFVSQKDSTPSRSAVQRTAQSSTRPELRLRFHCCIPVYQVAAGVPAPANMAYFGGHVQVTLKIYLVFWGWGQNGAFDHSTPGFPTYDPDGPRPG
jgi:prepilin-type processing-associated H-X9-DG protein